MILQPFSIEKMKETIKRKYANGYINPMKGKKRLDLSKYNRINKPLYLGKKNPNWKGGITNKNRLLRASKEYKDWKKAVLKRDKRCRFCPSIKNLEVHHIVAVHEFIESHPKAAFEVENGVVACADCHSKIDKFRGKFNG